MRSGRDPRRRNRNIGTAKQGHGQDNRLVIPGRWSDSSAYWEKLNDPRIVEKKIGDNELVFIIEPPASGFGHHCSISDVLRVLTLHRFEHIEDIYLIVFRQPTRKQVILSSVWGRLSYWSDLEGYAGTGICLEAQPVNRNITWPVSLKPDQAAELERLREDGHRITRERRRHLIEPTDETIRATQLYRTLPHEVGHYVDYLEMVERVESEGRGDDFWEIYGAKPVQEKEAFAHRYANEFRKKVKKAKWIPFAPLYPAGELEEAGLEVGWFPNHPDYSKQN